MDKPIKKIVIVGGGSAGWISAGVLAAEHMANSPKGIEVTLIESPMVKSIGVGEGTWPSMRNTLNKIGISELEFISQCDASFKQGSKFVGWCDGQSDDFYYHPFMTPEGYTQVNLHAGWQSVNKNTNYADTVNMQSHVCQAGLAPKQLATPQYAAVTNYGYHLDAAKFASLLQKHCTTKLNVNHILDHVVAINSAENGDIASISTKQSGDISGDLFIDCTGTSSLLLGKHYNIPFIDCKDVLFNDSALAVQIPYSDDSDSIASATISTAQTAGWIWDIGLPTRRGVGHTYSSAHMNDDEAERILREYIATTANTDISQSIEPRKISFRPGHYQKFWHKNCVAIGMSSGFLEPLEASALALIELATTMISEQLPTNRAHMEIVAKRYNERFDYRWQRVIEFLKLHYVLSRRNDSQYWRDNKSANTIPSRLHELLTLWQHQPPSRYDFVQNEEVFPSASYQYVLYGMGFNTKLRDTENRYANIDVAKKIFNDGELKLHKYLAGLPTNRDLINHLCQQHETNQR
ncbi:tryptophan halogenase family protein [Thalassotalea fonticola]|uniref:Tryptophan halogenase family protein n=1 Tax=Thalassotalea fonticola TaxID=3065649 RepID=A0ABZ0GNW8_9GAMM|nr:tryptophan halogenase family protein [Colwelliaceae bacterium S1-1]